MFTKMQVGDLEFRCPKCRSSYFGSVELSTNKLSRTCHGCHKFTWHEDEDYKYFVFLVRFGTREEYEQSWNTYKTFMEDLINGRDTKPEDRKEETGAEEAIEADGSCQKGTCRCFN